MKGLWDDARRATSAIKFPPVRNLRIIGAGVSCLLLGRTAIAEDTSIVEKDFQVTLPGVWTAKPNGVAGPWIYQASGRQEQVTVSAIWNKKGTNPAALKTVLATTVDIYRKAVEETSASYKLVLTPTLFGEVPAQGPFAMFLGLESTTGRQFATCAYATPNLILIVLHEAVGAAAKELKPRSRAIFNSVKLLDRKR